MNGLLRLRKLITTVITVCLATGFAICGTANASPLSDTNVSWNDFASTWSPTDVRVLEAPFSLNDGVSGKITSIAYLSNDGATKGKWVYAYQIVLEEGQSNAEAIALEVEVPIPTKVSNLFQTVKSSEDARFHEFRPEGVGELAVVYDTTTRTYKWLINGIRSGENSVVFGYLSDQGPTSAQIKLSSGSDGLTLRPSILVPSIEPSTCSLPIYSLLGVGISGLITSGLVAMNSHHDIPRPALAHTPEPSAFSLLGIGLLGIMGFRRRRK